MRILIFNWKDIRHPRAGGAELFTHEVAQRWVQLGHDVTLFTAKGSASPVADEVIDGVRVVRRGSAATVYRHARRYYRREGRGRFDVVLDEVNTRPFLCPRWVDDAAVVALIYQLARDVWRHEFPLPVAMVGRLWFEPRWLRSYRSVPVLTISASSRRSLIAQGLNHVDIVPVGVGPAAVVHRRSQRETRPTVVFVGRLSPNKRPDHALRAFERVRPTIPGVQMWVLGTGPLEMWLRYRYGSDHVRFFGRVTEMEKEELLGRAHVVLATSVREGWGLVVSEAAALGTPTIGYDVPGLRDSIPVSGGVLVAPTIDALAHSLGSLLPKWASGEAPAVTAGGVADWSEVAETVLEHLERASREHIERHARPR